MNFLLGLIKLRTNFIGGGGGEVLVDVEFGRSVVDAPFDAVLLGV